MALSTQSLSNAILRTWTNNENAGLASLETCPERDTMLSAQTMAISQAVCDAVIEAITWRDESAALSAATTFALAKQPMFHSLLIFIGGALLSPANWSLEGNVVTFAVPITGELFARYQTMDVRYRVLLVEVGERRIDVIKSVRALTNLGLGDAKTLVEAVSPSSPQIVLDGVDKSTAEDARAQLEAVGATVQVAEG